MKAVVTGGAGFIGSHLVDALFADPAGGASVEVLVLDDLSTGRKENLNSAEKVAGVRLRHLKCDIVSPEASQAIQEFRPDVVFHLAAQMNVRASMSDPVFDARSNVLGTVNLLEASRLAGVSAFLLASTGGAIYGEQDEFPAPENHAVRAESAYGVSKRCSEVYLEYFSRVYNLTAVSLRFANVYGPRQNPKGEAGVVAIFSKRLLAGESMRVNGDGLQTRDYVFVGDVVQASVLASKLRKPGTFSVFNVGLGRESSVLDLVEGMRRVVKSGALSRALPEPVVEFGPSLPGEQRRSCIDSAKLSRELGWKPQVNLEEGLKRTLQSFL